MDKYGLIGYPLGHSFSKGYFNEKFENEGIDAQYINFEIPYLSMMQGRHWMRKRSSFQG